MATMETHPMVYHLWFNKICRTVLDAADTGSLQKMLKFYFAQQEDVIYSSSLDLTLRSLSVANQKSVVLMDGWAIFNMTQLPWNRGRRP